MQPTVPLMEQIIASSKLNGATNRKKTIPPMTAPLIVVFIIHSTCCSHSIKLASSERGMTPMILSCGLFSPVVQELLVTASISPDGRVWSRSVNMLSCLFSFLIKTIVFIRVLILTVAFLMAGLFLSWLRSTRCRPRDPPATWCRVSRWLAAAGFHESRQERASGRFQILSFE